MGATPTYALPYPEAADPADVPTDMHELASAIEAIPALGYWQFLDANTIYTGKSAQVQGSFQVLGQFFPHSYISSQFQALNGYVLITMVPGDTSNRFTLQNEGSMYWGPGNAATDVRLWRSAAGLLRTAGQFGVDGPVYVDMAGTGSKLYFGSAQDTNLYRSQAAELRTEGGMVIVGNCTIAGAVGLTIYNYVQVGATVSGSAYVYFGTDTNLHRSGVSALTTDGTFRAVGKITDDTLPTRLMAAGSSNGQTDCNACTSNGYHFVGNAGANLPPGPANDWMLHVVAFSTSLLRQTAMSIYSHETWQRPGASGAWTKTRNADGTPA